MNLGRVQQFEAERKKRDRYNEKKRVWRRIESSGQKVSEVRWWELVSGTLFQALCCDVCNVILCTICGII